MDQRQVYRESKLLYDVISKSPQDIDKDKDRLSKIISLLGLSIREDDLQAGVDRLMQGLPKEDEFMAIAVWMEKCKLIHKLEQEQLPVSSIDRYRVPDFFAVFDYNGQEVPVLIEVKTSHQFIELKPSHPKITLEIPMLKFRKGQYEGLNNYADLVGLPLLIAWRVDGHYWMLFDSREVQRHESGYHIDWESAMKADLMFLLLDSVLVVPKSGVSFTFVFEDLDPAEPFGLEPNGEEHREHTMKVHGIRFLDASGDPITKVSWAQFILFGMFAHEEKQNWHGSFFELTFEVPEESSFLPSHVFLPFMLFGWRSEERRPKNWYDVIRKGDFGPVSYSQFRQAIKDSLGTFVEYILSIVPHNRPDFLPAE